MWTKLEDTFLSFLIIIISVCASKEEELNLPASHIEYVRGGKECWGYEPGCEPDRAFSQPTCNTKKTYRGRPYPEVFYEQADFGYLKNILQDTTSFCSSESPDKSALECSKNMLFCRARNLYLDLRNVYTEERNMKYAMDILKSGEIGGQCDEFSPKKFLDHSNFMSPLQSWMPEFRFYENLADPVNSSSTNGDNCDLYIEKKTYFMKLDATVNMYHHFCDFFNLYASLHLLSQYDGDAWTDDVNILIWDNSKYHSNFGDVFKAFSRNKLLNLKSFGKRKVCFKNAVFPLLPRMMFGLFYNTPVVDHCAKSGLFRAFSEFLNHRLAIPEVKETNSDKLRVTIISRMTSHRRILNEDELVKALEKTGLYDVTVARFTHATDFIDQMFIVRHSDILIGMHGSGLTHSLFLKDWAVLFEIYNCEDPGCYYDLARLRGVNYITWTDDTKLKSEDNGLDLKDPKRSHAKFTSYSFDADEFLAKVETARQLVLTNEEFQKLDVKRNFKKTEL